MFPTCCFLLTQFRWAEPLLGLKQVIFLKLFRGWGVRAPEAKTLGGPWAWATGPKCVHFLKTRCDCVFIVFQKFVFKFILAALGAWGWAWGLGWTRGTPLRSHMRSFFSKNVGMSDSKIQKDIIYIYIYIFIFFPENIQNPVPWTRDT